MSGFHVARQRSMRYKIVFVYLFAPIFYIFIIYLSQYSCFTCLSQSCFNHLFSPIYIFKFTYLSQYFFCFTYLFASVFLFCLFICTNSLIISLSRHGHFPSTNTVILIILNKKYTRIKRTKNDI